MRAERVKFDKNYHPEFFSTLKKRVNNYFESNNLSKDGSRKLLGKSLIVLSFYFGPFTLICLQVWEHPLVNLFLWLIMGIGMAGVGFSVMHDGNHGAFSKNKTLNKFMGYSLNLLGGDAKLWKLQHNVLHHTFTNVYESDEDIDGPSILRFSPHHKKLRIHKYQHLYAIFLYSLITVGWVFWKDYTQAARFKKKGLIKKEKFATEVVYLILWKIVYFGYLVALPILVFDVQWWVVCSGFMLMHFVCGIIISVVFQLAHVMPENEFPLPNDEGLIENSWAIHQLQTTCNFSQKSRLFSWYIGGLNFQIEHHLFASISHVHYKRLSKIVKQTAEEFNIPYKTHGNLFKAISYHFKMLKQLGVA